MSGNRQGFPFILKIIGTSSRFFEADTGRIVVSNIFNIEVFSPHDRKGLESAQFFAPRCTHVNEHLVSLLIPNVLDFERRKLQRPNTGRIVTWDVVDLPLGTRYVFPNLFGCYTTDPKSPPAVISDLDHRLLMKQATKEDLILLDALKAYPVTTGHSVPVLYTRNRNGLDFAGSGTLLTA